MNAPSKTTFNSHMAVANYITNTQKMYRKDYTAKEIQNMRDEDLLDMDYFLNE